MSDEAFITVPCFGGTVGVYAGGGSAAGENPADALRRTRETLLSMHAALTRFDSRSELSRLNQDTRETVQASALVQTVFAAVVEAAEISNGLVDATQLLALEASGYDRTWEQLEPVPLAEALLEAPARRPAQAAPGKRWRTIGVDPAAGAVTRTPGVMIDSGGIAKGLAADLIAAALEQYDFYAVDACGDIRVGGRLGAPREISVDDPFGRGLIHRLDVSGGGVATSGIGRRSWRDPHGRVAHHLLDPRSGEPAYTGVVQATALAGTAFEAEVRAKAAVLSGPGGADDMLPHGGLLVLDDGSVRDVQPHALHAAG